MVEGEYPLPPLAELRNICVTLVDVTDQQHFKSS